MVLYIGQYLISIHMFEANFPSRAFHELMALGCSPLPGHIQFRDKINSARNRTKVVVSQLGNAQVVVLGK
jgi:hypothetical protein